MTKTTKKSPAKKSTRASLTHKKRPTTKARPLHKRILLHPLSVMVLLCSGVLIVGLTLHSSADTVQINAIVEAPAVNTPATISTPLNAQHFNSPAVAISGSCADQSYVKVNVNATLGGVATCQSHSYTVPITLVAGANQVQPQIYNLTDVAGPTTAPITLYYDNTTITPPPAPATPPTTLKISTVENSTYQQGAVPQTSNNPTINGFAPPYSVITVTFHSVVETCTTVADANGYWSCTLDHELPIGEHHVDITAQATDGQKFTAPTFQITVLASLANLLAPVSVVAPTIHTNYQYQARRAGQPFNWNADIDGGQAPYSITVDWGDGTTYHLRQPDGSTFALNHAYKTPKDFAVSLTAVDANGSIGRFQMVAVVNVLAAPAGTISGDPFSSLFGAVSKRLWLIWPTYIVVVLMVIGYWLGEREEYQRLMMARRHVRPTGRSK